MLPQTVKLFRFMNINAPNQPRAAVAAAAAQELSGEGKGKQEETVGASHQKRAAWEYTQNRAAPTAAAAASRCPPRRNWQPHFPIAQLPAPLHTLAYTLPTFPPLRLPPGPSCCCSSSAFAAVGCAFCLFFCTSLLYRIYQLIKIRAFYIYIKLKKMNIYYAYIDADAVAIVRVNDILLRDPARRPRRRHTNYAIFSPQF